MARRRPWVIILTAAVGCSGTIGGSGETGAGGSPGSLGGLGGTGPGSTTTVVSDLPCDVETMLATRCWSCHSDRPLEGAPPLTSVAAFQAPSITDSSQTTGALALARIQSTASPMPPLPAAPATASEIATFSAWIAAGMPGGSGCAPVCTSNKTWTGGNRESPLMNPGAACIDCHASGGEGPQFSIAGTLYPTVHEPDLCDGADGANGATVVITGADGKSLTLSPNTAGNFYSETRVALPYQAKVVYMGRERAMTDAQTSGDCNACHTQAGTNNAPGRIVLP
jgi:cytochrome c553